MKPSSVPELSLGLLFRIYLNERHDHQFLIDIPADSPLENFLNNLTWYRGWKVGTSTIKFGDDKAKLRAMEIALPKNLRLLQERLLARQKKGAKKITGRETLELLSQINKELKNNG